MSLEAERAAEQQKEFASLQGCFVEGSAEQRARERRIRRRALIISVAVQTAILTLIVLIPLFGKPEAIVHAFVPIPPYYHNPPAARHEPPTRTPPRRQNFSGNPFLPPSRIPQRIDETPDPPRQEPPGIPTGSEPSTPCIGCIPLDGGRRQPEAPVEVKPQKPLRVFTGHIEPAMLIHRVEPIYPELARQTHVEGRVELHAIIATDGTIQSLQVVSGHPLLLKSAVEAVRQWRYKPTILNGQPVEVDTYITVIYTFQH